MRSKSALLRQATITRRRLAVVITLAAALVATAVGVTARAGSTAPSDPVVVGAIFDLSGPISVIGKPKADATKLAIKDINARGGVLGRQLKLVSFDAQSDNAKYTKYASTLILRHRVAMLEAGITSASREAIRPLVDRTKTVYFYANLYEGGVCDKNVFATGAVPAQQLAQLIPYAIKHFGKRFYIAAADYNFGHWEATWAKKYVKQFGGEVVRTDFIPLDNTDFGSVLNTLQSEKPDVVISLLVGGNQMSFYRQFTAAGLQKSFRIITPVFGDGQEQIVVGPKASNGVIIAYPYLQEVNSPANQRFLALWRKEYGKNYPYINPSAMAAWDAWHLWAQAVNKAGSLDRDKVVKALESGLSYDSPAGRVHLNPGSHHVTQNVYLAEGTASGKFKVLQTFKSVPPSYENSVCNLVKNPNTNKQFIPSES